jgi:Tfp pilus assembly protein PilF
MRLLVVLLFVLPLLSACETVKQGIKDVTAVFSPDAPRPEPQAARSAEDLLAAGVAQYEEGNYAQAQRLLQSSLAEGLSSRTNQARAYKYLAFIYCVTDRSAQCRQEFSNALNADPKFTLTAAEAGHPTWGPVFRSVSRGR